MKKIIIICGLFFLAFRLGAQVEEVKKFMSLGTQKGFKLTTSAEPKMVEKVWKEYSKTFGKIIKNKKARESLILGAKLQAISPGKKIDVYTISEVGSFTVFFDMKNGFLNSADFAKESMAAKDLLQEFGYEVQRTQVNQELETEKAKLKKATKELENLKLAHVNYNFAIEEAKEKIRRSEANIIQNLIDQKRAEENIILQTQSVEKVMEKLSQIGKN
jgi:hypothetical protein